MLTLYGISNCDTIRKAGKWLDANAVPWVLHDYRKHGLDTTLAAQLLEQFGPVQLINRRGTTWRSLSGLEQSKAESTPTAAALIVEYPALIRRPVAQTHDGRWLMGYDALVADTQ